MEHGQQKTQNAPLIRIALADKRHGAGDAAKVTHLLPNDKGEAEKEIVRPFQHETLLSSGIGPSTKRHFDTGEQIHPHYLSLTCSKYSTGVNARRGEKGRSEEVHEGVSLVKGGRWISNERPALRGRFGGFTAGSRNRDKPENTIMHHIIAAGNDLAIIGHLTLQPLYTDSGEWYFCGVDSKSAK
jgi:hypothetical protein